MFHRDSFQPSELIVVKKRCASSLLLPGEFVRLNSGGPIGVMMALDGQDRATVHWLIGGASTLPATCFTPCVGV